VRHSPSPLLFQPTRPSQQVSLRSEFSSKACQSNYPILPSAKISPNGFLTAFTAFMIFEENHVPTTCSHRYRHVNHRSTNFSKIVGT
jgi:hypothetical protein